MINCRADASTIYCFCFVTRAFSFWMCVWSIRELYDESSCPSGSALSAPTLALLSRERYRRVMEMLGPHWLYAKWRIHYRSDRGLFFFPLLSFMETESVEVHCWTSQIDKVKMYGWSVKVFYTSALFVYFLLYITYIIWGFLQLLKCLFFFSISATIKHYFYYYAFKTICILL